MNQDQGRATVPSKEDVRAGSCHQHGYLLSRKQVNYRQLPGTSFQSSPVQVNFFTQKTLQAQTSEVMKQASKCDRKMWNHPILLTCNTPTTLLQWKSPFSPTSYPPESAFLKLPFLKSSRFSLRFSRLHARGVNAIHGDWAAGFLPDVSPFPSVSTGLASCLLTPLTFTG